MIKKTLILLTVLIAMPVFAENFTLESPEIASTGFTAEQEFSGFGCSGKNVSPKIEWKNPPANTKSFGLTMYDPDAPTGSGWWHWVVVNIPQTASALNKGSGDVSAKKAPVGVLQTRTDFGAYGYGGPCPPEGSPAHRYKFKLFALNVEKLPVEKDSSAALVGYMLNTHSIASTEFTVNYQR